MSIRQRARSLKSRKEELSDTFFQLKVLNSAELAEEALPTFGEKLTETGYSHLVPRQIEVMQVNVGKLCNQSCAHCHVDAGPDRTEVMTRETMAACLDVIAQSDIPIVDITGGAPELNPHFRWFVQECTALGKRIIDRCNLTIIMSNPRFRDLPDFLAQHNVQIIASLPYFSKSRTDAQRGDGVFDDSIRALSLLNAVGYGKPDSGLVLDLVYNPSGAFLPSGQHQLEAEFKRQLWRRHQLVFNNLYAITNLPISRFLEYLLDSGNYSNYMSTLINAFNPDTIDGLMCRNTISVGWDGYVYDCDFNQMLDLKVACDANHITQFDAAALARREVVTNRHCFGCTAGAGSSCGGEIA
jgi:radical SAM/Cys-rich protein